MAPSIRRSLSFAGGLGTFVGLYVGWMIWPGDPIAGSYLPYVAATLAIFVLLFGLFVGLIVRKHSISNKALRGSIWIAILGCIAFGPVSFAFAPTVIQHRVARNERLASERFIALKDAMDRALRAYGIKQIYDARALQPHYFGPPFDDANWKRMAGNFVKEDGYLFIIYAEKDSYTIAARPAKERLDGTRQFCTDESGRTGCRVEWNGSRNACQPCSK